MFDPTYRPPGIYELEPELTISQPILWERGLQGHCPQNESDQSAAEIADALCHDHPSVGRLLLIKKKQVSTKRIILGRDRFSAPELDEG